MIVPQGDDPLEGGDELLFVATSAVEEEIRAALGTERAAARRSRGNARRAARQTAGSGARRARRTAQIVPSNATPTSG